MTVDRSVISALESALVAEPDVVAVRLHLASLLVLAGDPERALVHSAAVLSVIPDSVEALAISRDAARALGDTKRVEAYERLLGVAGPATTAPAVPADLQAVRVDADDASDDVIESVDAPPTVTLADVGGLEQVKARLELAFLAPLRNPEARAYYGKSLRGGLLLYGPPGCGKTFIARALAGELAARFLSVGLSDVLDMWLGESERHLHEIFAAARRAAPCVLFFDEIDALGRKRSQMRNSAGRNVINQLLAELDGAESANEGVFVLAATNHPWDVDTALRRPGRLDRAVLVLPPDQDARRTILERSLAERPTHDIDVAWLAKQTKGFSGADLVQLCEVAAERALADSLKTGDMRPIDTKDFKTALREVAPSTTPWFSVAHSYAMYANEGGQYDDLLAYVREHKLL